MSQRVCFLLQVRPERLDDYLKTHEAVWPEMLQALSDAGWREYSLFHRENGLVVGYLECDDFDVARELLGATDVNTRWQAMMAEYFTDLDGQRVDESLVQLTEYFHLD